MTADGDPAVPPNDGKDWTWVLERPCPDCGFDAAAVEIAHVGRRTRAAAAALRARLGDADATTRPAPGIWSPLEYAAHVRDVCIVFGARLSVMRSGADPLFADWDQDATALAERYWEQRADVVADQLTVESERIAVDLDSVQPDEFGRTGRRSNGSAFTVESLARYFLHDLEHHVHDVTTAPPTG